jgi:hypothetical protein
LSSVIETQRKAIETAELEQRIERLEQVVMGKQNSEERTKKKDHQKTGGYVEASDADCDQKRVRDARTHI